VAQYVARFRSPVVRQVVEALMTSEMSAMGLFMMLGTRLGGNAGYPLGGALEMVRRMVDTYRGLGGTIHFESKVDEILIESGGATGVRVADAVPPADAVVAACDAYNTLKRMLGGAYAHPQLDQMLASSPLFPPLALVCFGLTQHLGIPYEIQYEFPDGLEAPGGTIYGLSLRSFDFDPAAAPEGGSSVMAMVSMPLDYWADLRAADLAAYREQKARLAAVVADAIEARLPGFRRHRRYGRVHAGHLRAVGQPLPRLLEGFLPVPAAIKTQSAPPSPGWKAW
jgi:phytoene dehydrogenase-like protein